MAAGRWSQAAGRWQAWLMSSRKLAWQNCRIRMHLVLSFELNGQGLGGDWTGHGSQLHQPAGSRLRLDLLRPLVDEDKFSGDLFQRA